MFHDVPDILPSCVGREVAANPSGLGSGSVSRLKRYSSWQDPEMQLLASMGHRGSGGMGPPQVSGTRGQRRPGGDKLGELRWGIAAEVGTGCPLSEGI